MKTAMMKHNAVLLVGLLVGTWNVEMRKANSAPIPDTMVRIPAGEFRMGDAFSEASDMESPVHVVYISTFYIEKTEVTYDAWDDVATWATNHGYSFGPMGQNYGNYPREDISWYNAAKWCNARSEKDGRVPAYYTDETQTTVYREGELNLRNSWVEWKTGYRLPT